MADAATYFIYPSALARDAALDEACASQASGAVWAGEHLTFAQLLMLLGRHLPSAENGARKLVQGAARSAVIGRAWAEAAGKDAHEPTRAAVDSLGSLISAWKGAGAKPKAVASAAVALRKRHARLAERLAFAARVYALYEQALGKEWTDREGRELDMLARLAAAKPGAVFESGTRLRVSGFQRLTPVHRAVLQRLRDLGCVVSIAPLLALPRDERSSHGGDREPEPLETLVRSFGPLFECLAGDPPAAAGRVLRIEAPTPYSEIYEIGRRVRHWIEREGVAPARIGVAFRDLGPYSQFVADVFGRLNIPMYERRGEPAAFQPLVRAALTALDAARAGLQREELFRFLCSGLAALRSWSNGSVAPDPFKLHEIALAARIDRFFGADANRPAASWREKLDVYASSIKKEGAANDARCAAETIGAIASELESLRAPRTRAKFADAWRAFFEKAGLLEPPAGSLEDGAQSRRLAESRAALAEVLDEAAQGPGAAKENVPLERFVELVAAAVAGRSVRLSGLDRAGGVRVLNLYDLRGLRFDYLVIAGMDETRFPKASAPDALFGAPGGTAVADLRAALEAAAPELRPLAGVEPRLPGEIRDEERALLEIARRAVNPRGQLVLTRSRTVEDGRIVGPSVFWDGFAPEAAAIHEAAPVRPAPPLAECITGEEAELRAAWVLGGGVPAGSAETALAASAAAKSGGAHAGRMDRLMECARIEQRRASFFEDLVRAPEAEGEDAHSAPGRNAGTYDGIVADPAARQIQERILARSFSPSALERQAQCGFRFLAEDLYRVSGRESPDEDLSPLSSGNLWHEILSGFYRERIREANEAGMLAASLDPRRMADHLRDLQQRAEREFERAPRRYFTGHPGLWGVQRERILFGLGVWLEYEMREAAGTDPFRPAFVEFAFGTGEKKHAPPVEVPIATSEGPRVLRLEGRIDRVDLRLTSNKIKSPTVTGVSLIDYKHGRIGGLKARLKAEELHSLRHAQLPVYLAAALAYLKMKEREHGWSVDWDAVRESSRAALLAFRDLPAALRGGSSARVEPVDEAAEFLRRIASSPGDPKELFDAVRHNVGLVLAGRFPVAPVECAGISCAARFACRYRELAGTDEQEGGA